MKQYIYINVKNFFPEFGNGGDLFERVEIGGTRSKPNIVNGKDAQSSQTVIPAQSYQTVIPTLNPVILDRHTSAVFGSVWKKEED